ncbi:MAG: RNA polymerase sigma-70 factor [Prevotella sp.]|nr:RNA polymerase sigma-70 factor [Prevotella sp.]
MEREMTAKRSESAIAGIGLLYKEHYRQLYLYALTFLSNEDEAKDVVNDAFEQVWKNWQSGDCREQTVKGFLYRLVRNLCLDILRHRRVHDRYAQMSLATSNLQDASNEDVMEFEERILRLRKAVDELPEPDRSILKCCYFKKLTYKQTAEELELTVNVVHRHMVNAFRQLRQMLKM